MGEDLYRAWLDIPAGERPPDHYALLGLPPLTDDLRAIDAAARARLSQLDPYTVQLGAAKRQAAGRIMTEVAQARACLVDSQRKRDYDRWLAAELNLSLPQAIAPPSNAAAGRRFGSSANQPDSPMAVLEGRVRQYLACGQRLADFEPTLLVEASCLDIPADVARGLIHCIAGVASPQLAVRPPPLWKSPWALAAAPVAVAVMAVLLFWLWPRSVPPPEERRPLVRANFSPVRPAAGPAADAPAYDAPRQRTDPSATPVAPSAKPAAEAMGMSRPVAPPAQVSVPPDRTPIRPVEPDTRTALSENRPYSAPHENAAGPGGRAAADPTPTAPPQPTNSGRAGAGDPQAAGAVSPAPPAATRPDADVAGAVAVAPTSAPDTGKSMAPAEALAAAQRIVNALPAGLKWLTTGQRVGLNNAAKLVDSAIQADPNDANAQVLKGTIDDLLRLPGDDSFLAKEKMWQIRLAAKKTEIATMELKVAAKDEEIRAKNAEQAMNRASIAEYRRLGKQVTDLRKERADLLSQLHGLHRQYDELQQQLTALRGEEQLTKLKKGVPLDISP